MRKCTGESIREDLHLRSVQGSVKDSLEATQLGQDNELDVDALISRGYEDSVQEGMLGKYKQKHKQTNKNTD